MNSMRKRIRASWPFKMFLILEIVNSPVRASFSQVRWRLTLSATLQFHTLILGLLYYSTVPAVFDLNYKKNKVKNLTKNSDEGLKKTDYEPKSRRYQLLNSLSEEEKEVRKEKNKQLYKRYKKMSICEMTEEQKERQRNIWRNNTRKFRERKTQQQAYVVGPTAQL